MLVFRSIVARTIITIVVAAIALCCTVTSASATTSVSAAAGTTGSGFLTRQGSQLFLNGSTYRFVGVNAYGLASCESITPGYYTGADLDAFFQQLPPNTVTRVFATSLATIADIDLVVARAAANRQMLILSLVDGANNCNAGKKKLDRSWYQSGYKAYYLGWIDYVVSRFRNSTAIAMWEIANEPGWGCPGDCGVTKDEMKSFFDTAAARIKRNDPNHLVESGAMGKDIAAMWASADYAYVQSGPDVDVTSMHEYEYEWNGNTGAGTAFPYEKRASDSINKPIIIGETGAPLSLPTNATCRDSSVTEQDLMKSKFDSYLAGGASGVLIWSYMKTLPVWLAPGCSSRQHFFYGTNNPVFSMLRSYPL